jgi:hypothetical protein
VFAAFVEPARDRHGVVTFPPVPAGPSMSGKKLFAYQLFLLGIRDPDAVARLWGEEQARRKAEAAKTRNRRPGR